jgi:hypothetical protein
MATYSVISNQRLDNYVVVQLLTNADPLEVGQSFTLSSMPNSLNGTFTVYALPQYLFTGVDTYGELTFNPEVPVANQVLFYSTGTDIERVDFQPLGVFTTTPTCTWISHADVEDWLGIGTASALDDTFLIICAAAANAFCYKRRQEAGYVDSLTTVPNQAVKLGVIGYGGFLYRQRGAISDFASFDGMSTGGSVGLSPMIKQLLGIDRPAVA